MSFSLEQEYWDELDKAEIFTHDGETWLFNKPRLEKLLENEKTLDEVRYIVSKFFREPSNTNTVWQILNDLAECYEALGKVKEAVSISPTKHGGIKNRRK